jgi:hypothetical protein
MDFGGQTFATIGTTSRGVFVTSDLGAFPGLVNAVHGSMMTGLSHGQ